MDKKKHSYTMPRSKFVVYRSSPGKNRHKTNENADNSKSSPIGSSPEKRPLNNNRFHPYQRNEKRDGNGHSFQNAGQNDRFSYFTFTRLKKLSKMNSDDCVAELEGKKDQFNQLLNDILRPDVLVLTVQVLTNICRANFTEIVTSVLSHACSATFLKNLENYLTKLPFENEKDKSSNELYWEDKSGFWNNLVVLFKKITELLPSKARDELVTVLGKTKSVITTTESMQDYKIDENVKETILIIHDELSEEIVKFKTRNTVEETSTAVLKKSEDPPEDFRTLSVIPTIQDLGDDNPFIRPCKLEGAYDSVEHYLDVQFRLLREDFIAPLRDGIREYLHGPKKYRNTQLRIYKKVELMKSEEAANDVSLIASFGKLTHVDWNYSKRFLFGGLLCLSSDNFSSILFATVANRDEKLLQQGQISIQPCEETVITEDFYHSNWVMLETKIYFEPYHVVLNAMRHMNDENFPMKKYLVDADTSNSLPRYLRADGVYQETDAVLSYKGFSLPMGDNQAWPSPEELEFDKMQYEAFKAALSQEFAVIQGPPGTGKTFIALQIIRTLLENRSHWIADGPIVIVCLTNHALDQFLEGILKYTTSIVRVGSRSKSEALSEYTLAERRKILPSIKKCDRSFALRIANKKKYTARCILRNIERTRVVLKYLNTKDAVVPLNLLQEYCTDDKLHEFYRYDEMLRWLLENKNDLMETDVEPGEIISDPEMDVDERYGESDNISFSDYPGLHYVNEFDVNQEEQLVFLLQSIEERISSIQAAMHTHLGPRRSIQFQQLQSEMDALQLQRLYLEHNLAQHPLLTSKPEIIASNTRWQCYWKWVKTSHENAVQELRNLEKDYHRATLELNEARQMVDLDLLQRYRIVGFTTTSAARLHASLRALRAPIVLVEEAAEILESHVVCSLTKSCQHVILIGDHKQLRPKAAVHRLGTKYNLNISLFERMVNIRGSCTQLAHQHRMRPEIARLICPSIYETLNNHQSVLEYPSIMGLEKNIFFINHKHREISRDNQESWTNPHEAKFLVAFARHLILQGYKSTEITIICTYTGQLFTIITERNYYPIMKEVRVTTIDNYQGEENRIILLSLVRNNEEGNIGFLKEENRVCVALSRAREGLYIMGNMDNLTTKNDIWPKIKTVLEESKAIGDSLELRCKFHPEKLTNIKESSDFEQCPEGGCLLKCNTYMSCGHMCTSICHTTDREHVNFTCKVNCVKNCPDDHPCPLLCYQGCKPCKVTVDRQLKCGHTVHILCAEDPDTYRCPVKVDTILPGCKHTIQKACYLPLDKAPCTHPCEIRLPCGHTCELICHATKDPDHLKYVCGKPCTKSNGDCTMDHPCKLQCHETCKPCPVVVSKKRSCGHERMWKCSGDIEKVPCYKMIRYEKSCGHKLTVRCAWKDEECEEEVMKTSTCGHEVLVKCCETPSSSQCKNKCKLKLKCGHPCTARCKDACITKCNALITEKNVGLCGHIISVPCYLKETDVDSSMLLQYCKEPCKAKLACDHICKGTCGSCKQGRIHKPCGEKCGNIFICGHGCKVPCRQECPPCKEPCQVKCQHNKCNKKCGELCTPCKEPCTARCRHTRCMKRCFELCSREPCEKPCFNVLKCGHKCIGFCGEPCPQLCRICNKKELMDEFFLGHEDEPNARFVLLEDCGHCIESQGLSTWISKSNESIQVKTCPRCKTPIIKCMRISNQIKRDLKNIQLVKKKIFGDQANLQDQQLQLVKKIKDMKTNPVFHEFKGMKFLQYLDESMALVTRENRRQIVNSRAAEASRIVLDISKEICDKVEKIENRTVSSYESVKSQTTMLFASLPTRGQISNQEIKDIERELQRLHYMIEVCIMESEAGLNHNQIPAAENPYNYMMKRLQYFGGFSEAIEKGIVNDLNEFKTSHHAKVVLMNERKMIIKVMGYKQGHWYKCPNGHIYSIGECGGAMQESVCHECGNAIGGRSHRLTSGNSVATEMDGATHPAWPGGI